MRGIGGRAFAIVLCLGLAPSLAGCFGTLVHFTGPEGASVRIDDGAPETIPFARRVGSGVHALEIRALAGVGESPRSARGVLVLLEPRGRDFPDVRLEEDDLARALGGSAYSTSLQDAEWREVGFLKISAAGVPKDDGEVEQALARAAERKAALAAERIAEEEREREEARERKAARAAARKQTGAGTVGTGTVSIPLGGDPYLNAIFVVVVILFAILKGEAEK